MCFFSELKDIVPKDSLPGRFSYLDFDLAVYLLSLSQIQKDPKNLESAQKLCLLKWNLADPILPN